MKTRALLLLGGMLLVSSSMFGAPCVVATLIGSQTNTQFPAFSSPTETKVATYNGVSTLISFESDVFGTASTGVPEPLSLSLVGAGLIALGVLGRKKLV